MTARGGWLNFWLDLTHPITQPLWVSAAAVTAPLFSRELSEQFKLSLWLLQRRKWPTLSCRLCLTRALSLSSPYTHISFLFLPYILPRQSLWIWTNNVHTYMWRESHREGILLHISLVECNGRVSRIMDIRYSLFMASLVKNAFLRSEMMQGYIFLVIILLYGSYLPGAALLCNKYGISSS